MHMGDVQKWPLLRMYLPYCHGNSGCLLVPLNPILTSKTAVKSSKCQRPFLKSITTIQINTFTRWKTIFLVYIYVCGILLHELYMNLTVKQLDGVSAIFVHGAWACHATYMYHSIPINKRFHLGSEVLPLEWVLVWTSCSDYGAYLYSGASNTISSALHPFEYMIC